MSEKPDAPRALVSTVVLHDRNGSYLDGCVRRLKAGGCAGEVTVVECAHATVETASSVEQKNQAVARAHTDFVLLVSSMDLAEPECVQRLSDFMQSHSDVAGAGALLLAENGWPRRSSMRFPSVWRFFDALRRWLFALNPRAQRYGALRIEQEAQREVDALPTSCVMIRRKAFEEVGQFERGCEFRFDDIDWGWRARRKGWRLCIVPAARAFHVAPLLHGPIPVGVRLAYEQSVRRFLLRHRGGGYRALFWVSRMIGVAATGACAALIAFLTAFRSHSAVEHFRGNLAVLRWRLSGCPDVESVGAAEQTTRWEYAGWRAD